MFGPFLAVMLASSSMALASVAPAGAEATGGSFARASRGPLVTQVGSARPAPPLRYRLTATPIVSYDRTDGALSYEVYGRLDHRLPDRDVTYLRQLSLAVGEPGRKRTYTTDAPTFHVGGRTSDCVGAEGVGLDESVRLPDALRHPSPGKLVVASFVLRTNDGRTVRLRRLARLEPVPAGRYVVSERELIRRLGCREA